MDEFTEAKKWITASITATELLSLHPCLVRHICLTSDPNNASKALIYNGESTTSPLRLALTELKKKHTGDDFDVPVYFSRGIYVVLSGTPELFTIQYQEEVAH